ncbi:hypothetical protein E0H65_35690 [Rhizobium leguminosarum bv. viciae]|nr:hypothetical protein E0H65_35690 [Rhizobium leguminosarum bv. viciae]
MLREIPEGWEVHRIADVASVKGGKRMPAGRPFADGKTDHPYIRVSDFSDGSINRAGIVYVLPEDQKLIARYTISCRDVYISIAGTIGVCGMIPPDLDGAQLTENAAKIAVQSEAQLMPEFLALLLSSQVVQRQISTAKGVGGGVPKLALFRIEGMTIPVPPLHEQRRIAEILSGVDAAIAATRAVIEQTRKVKQGVLERLLTKGIGHTHFKQTEIGEIPEGWPLTTAEDVCTQISVGIVIKPSHYYAETGIRCFRSANVREGFVEDADWVYITEEGNRVNRKSVLRTGDVLVVRTGYPGTSCVVPPRYDGANCIDIIFARPKNELIEATFLSTFINSESGKMQVLKAEGGLAQKHFNVGAMKQMKLPLPPISEQREIVAHVDEFASNEAVLEQTLQQQIRAKSALMSDLLTGRRRVADTLPMAAE